MSSLMSVRASVSRRMRDVVKVRREIVRLVADDPGESVELRVVGRRCDDGEATLCGQRLEDSDHFVAVAPLPVERDEKRQDLVGAARRGEEVTRASGSIPCREGRLECRQHAGSRMILWTWTRHVCGNRSRLPVRSRARAFQTLLQGGRTEREQSSADDDGAHRYGAAAML